MVTRELSEAEVRPIISSLDTYSRIWMGQCDHFEFGANLWYGSRLPDEMETTAQVLLLEMRRLLVPAASHFGWNGSLGIWSPQVNELAVCAYDQQQVIRHAWAWYLHPEGGYTVNFRTLMLYGSLPLPQVSCLTHEDGTPAMRIALEDESAHLLLDALLAMCRLRDHHIEEMLRLYTTDERVLTLARDIEDLYDKATAEGYGDNAVIYSSDAFEVLDRLVDWLAGALHVTTDASYRSLALDRADAGEPLSYQDRGRKALWS